MDPYVYPETSVLRNLRDIRDPKALAQFEADVTWHRLKQLESNPIRGSFDTRRLKIVHAYIFQDVYAWAGEFRTVNIARSDQFYFAFANQIDSSVTQLLGQLRAEGPLKGLGGRRFRHALVTTSASSTRSIPSATATAAHSASSSGNSP